MIRGISAVLASKRPDRHRVEACDDGIVRLASMPKPITAVAVMMMLEQGKLRLSDARR